MRDGLLSGRRFAFALFLVSAKLTRILLKFCYKLSGLYATRNTDKNLLKRWPAPNLSHPLKYTIGGQTKTFKLNKKIRNVDDYSPPWG